MNSKAFIKKVAWRYFRSRRSGERLISVVSTISVVGVAIGCFALVVTLSILNGFRAEITERMMRFEPALISEQFPMKKATVDKLAGIAANDSGIRKTVPLIERKAMVTSESGTEVVYIKSLQVTNEQYPLRSEIIGGEFDLGTAESPGAVLGFQLSDKLGVTVGDTVAMISPLEMSGPFYTPPVVQAEVTGIFRAELFQYDQTYVFTNIAAGQSLFRFDDNYTGVEYFLSDFESAGEKAALIKSEVGDDSVMTSTWYERHQTLYGAMRMEKWGSLIVLTLIILVATFNLISSLVMLVLEKIRDIGILKTLGASDVSVRRIFLRQGWYVGSIGTAVGVVVGIALVLIQEFTGVVPLPGDVYFIDAVPVLLKPLDVALVIVISIVLSVVSAVYPAKQASELQPIEAISYDR
ncbi:MAG: FtsX-like permease family protein [Candidatus Marinimicrobia bacterium]|nr:FtsX-like permease family protein [Candidatus Neomarinimicrobiota bacterium]MCF7828972.1 FtsX-like permease family protein [Candidatus Neomarinimicrobiota bacterium]MCF7879932.1 FtsX-like permease family protein [Candidatus Neomarinimicrobiota bacterium]